jgi:hypothetical protein
VPCWVNISFETALSGQSAAPYGLLYQREHHRCQTLDRAGFKIPPAASPMGPRLVPLEIRDHVTISVLITRVARQRRLSPHLFNARRMAFAIPLVPELLNLQRLHARSKREAASERDHEYQEKSCLTHKSPHENWTLRITAAYG